MIKVKHKGDFENTKKLLMKCSTFNSKLNLDRFGERGVAALSSATPSDSGLTARSWTYEIKKEKGKCTISFHNSNIQNGAPIAILLQYGHGTRNGGWVAGRDYINPAIQPIFDEIADSAWKEVKRRG